MPRAQCAAVSCVGVNFVIYLCVKRSRRDEVIVPKSYVDKYDAIKQTRMSMYAHGKNIGVFEVFLKKIFTNLNH